MVDDSSMFSYIYIFNYSTKKEKFPNIVIVGLFSPLRIDIFTIRTKWDTQITNANNNKNKRQRFGNPRASVSRHTGPSGEVDLKEIFGQRVLSRT